MFRFNNKPKLSIIIPVFNTEEYIAECLDSVLQATKDIKAEIILVDDGSEDGSIDIIRKYMERSTKFILLHTGGKGPGGARNVGVDYAKGEYIAFVDSDDIVAADIYENMITVADYDKCDMVVCDVIRKDANKYLHSELHRKSYHNLRRREVDVNKDLDLTFDCTVWNRLIRTSLYKKNKVSFPNALYCEDFPVVQWLYFLSRKTMFIHKWGYCWRVRKDSITRRYTLKHLEDEIRMLDCLKELAKKNNPNQAYADMLDYKILALEFVGCMNLLKDLPKDTARDYVERIASFIESSVNLDNICNINLYNKQKVALILNRDVDGLIRLINYKKANYMNAPVIKKEGDYEMVLPKDIFTITDRSIRNEFANMPYWMSIDDVEQNGFKLIVHTHVYIRRISMPDFESQHVRVFLINDLSGTEIELDVRKEKRPSLTKARGKVLSYDDYREYSYNYDGTGFSFTINAESIANDSKFLGWNYIMLECKNAVGKKNQILRFGTAKAMNTINSTCFDFDNTSVKFETDEIQNFGIKVNNIKTQCKKRNL